MTTKDTATPDVPPAAVVVYGTDEVAPPNAKDAKAAAEREASDRARGYREIAWKPGVTMWQVIASGATFLTEYEAQAHVTERQSADVTFAATPR